MSYEYKCVGAPERGKRRRGAKTRSDRVANAMEEMIVAEAVDGWEYMRTDLVPVEERAGWFGRTHEVHRAILIFRRSLEASAPSRSTPSLLRPAPANTQEDRMQLAAERDG
ncbi:MAG: DUF4177 domain-containing protein [Pseudomonadota bacterium]